MLIQIPAAIALIGCKSQRQLDFERLQKAIHAGKASKQDKNLALRFLMDKEDPEGQQVAVGFFKRIREPDAIMELRSIVRSARDDTAPSPLVISAAQALQIQSKWDLDTAPGNSNLLLEVAYRTGSKELATLGTKIRVLYELEEVATRAEALTDIDISNIMFALRSAADEEIQNKIIATVRRHPGDDINEALRRELQRNIARTPPPNALVETAALALRENSRSVPSVTESNGYFLRDLGTQYGFRRLVEIGNELIKEANRSARSARLVRHGGVQLNPVVCLNAQV